MHAAEQQALAASAAEEGGSMEHGSASAAAEDRPGEGGSMEHGGAITLGSMFGLGHLAVLDACRAPYCPENP